MPGTGLPKGERRKRRRSEGGRGNKTRDGRRVIVIIWSVLLCLTTVVVLGLTVWLWLLPMLQRRDEIVRHPVVETEKEIGKKSIAKFASLPEEEAVDFVKQALGVREVEKVADFFVPGSRTPEQVVEFLGGLEKNEGAIDRIEWVGSIDANDLSLDGVLVNFKGADKPRNRLAFLTVDTAGRWRVDFESFARVATPAWSELMDGKASAATVRIYAAPDYYYNGPFLDESKWACYGIASPDQESVMLAYCKKDTPQALAMARVLRDGKMARATLEIRRVEGAESRQFEISKVIAEDWVIAPTALEERFK